MHVIGIGDNVCDLYLHTGMMYPGGQALNFAVNTNAMGLCSHYMGVFGTDEVAAHVKAVLTKRKIPFPMARTYPGENGYARVELRQGDRVFLGSNKGGVLRDHPLELEAKDLTYLRQFLVAHTTNNAYFDAQLPKLAGLGLLISYDYSTRWNEMDRVARTAPYVNIAFISCGGQAQEEAVAEGRRLCSSGIDAVCATLGSQGAVLCSGGDVFFQPSAQVRAVDTMGAGDAFASRLLAGLATAAESDGPGCWADLTWRSRTLHAQLPGAAEYAAQACLLSGSFGEGAPIPPEIQQRL